MLREGVFYAGKCGISYKSTPGPARNQTVLYLDAGNLSFLKRRRRFFLSCVICVSWTFRTLAKLFFFLNELSLWLVLIIVNLSMQRPKGASEEVTAASGFTPQSSCHGDDEAENCRSRGDFC